MQQFLSWICMKILGVQKYIYVGTLPISVSFFIPKTRFSGRLTQSGYQFS